MSRGARPNPGSATTLCPIDLERCLEGASGGAIHWDTQESVLNRAKNARSNEQLPEKGVHHDSTNFAFVLFQQVSMLQSWWAQGEARWKKGLTNRFLFSTGRRPIESPVAPGMVGKLRAFLVRLLKHVARNYGAGQRPGSPWTLSPVARSAFLEARAICSELAQERLFGDGGSFHSMLEKVPYWLCHESFTNEVLQRACCGGLQQQTALPEISELSAKLALEFIHLRLSCL